jgi:flagellar basal body-associated protein FliL
MRTENSSNKIFIIVIALLLIANIVTLTLLLTDKKTNYDDHKSSMRNYLKTEIGF